MGSWLSQYLKHSSYLQLYWLLQAGHVTMLALYRVVTKDWPHVSETDPADRRLGWFEFRKRTTLCYMIGCVWSIYMLWEVVRGYCFDVVPSERFQHIYDFLVTPNHVTVDVWSTYIAMGLYSLHIARRLYECMFTCIFSRHRTVGPIQFVTELVFYVAAGLSLIAESPPFVGQEDCFGMLTSWRWYQIPAVLTCVLCTKVQTDTFDQLQKMRRNRAGHIVTTGYKVPRGGWFHTLNVVSPHYLAEVAIHVAVGVALGGRNITWWLLTAYVLVNHFHLAYDKVLFYRHKFGHDFPASRHILFPWIF
jgi:hypothetical protein